MKLNWGHKLTFFAGLFMLFVVFMVYRISTQKVDLVDKDYYERGVKYQNEINKYAAANAVQHNIDFDLTRQQLTFKASNPLIKGTVYFYRAADASMDFEKPFALNAEGSFNYSTEALQKGIWKITFE